MFKKLMSVLVISILMCIMLSMVAPQSANASPGWWDPSWQYRMKLTFDNSASSENLIDFPVLVNLGSTYSDFWAHINNGITTGDTCDLRFVDADDSTELYFEAEMINYASNEATIWVRVPQIDAGSTTDFIYIYYGNPLATQSIYHSANDVWDSNFEMVQHFNETSGTHYDSTTNGNDGIPQGGVTQDTTGMANGADEFDGSNDYINVTDYSWLNGLSSITWEMWVKSDVIGVDRIISSAVGNDEWMIRYDRSGWRGGGTRVIQWAIITTGGEEGRYESASNVQTTNWQYIAAIWTGSNLRLYLDGQEDIPTYHVGATGTTSGAIHLQVGHSGASGSWWDGKIDEIRISDTARSADWIYAQYLSMNDAFITFGGEEIVTPPTVITNSATNITTTAARLNGDLTSLGTANNVTVSFEWGLTTSYGNVTTPQSVNFTGTFFFDLGSLLPGTVYHFRAKAVGHGSSNGTDSSFTTATIPPTVITNGATNITTTDARLNGDLTSLGTAGNVTISFEWGLTTGYGNVTTPQSVNSTGTFFFDLGSLSPNTTYHFRAKAVGHGTSNGTDSSFVTGTTPPTVTTSGSTNITVSEATLIADLTSLGTASTVDVSFQWGTVAGTYPDETTQQSMSATGAFNFILSSLNPGTTYYFRAKADGGVHGTGYGVEMSFITPDIPVADFYYQPIGGEAPITIHFQDMSTGDITSWVWDFGDGGSSTQQNPSHTYTSTGSYTIKLTVIGPGGTNTKSDCISVSESSNNFGRGLQSARFSCRHLNISPTHTFSNQPVTISLSIVNTGGTRGSYNVALNINGNIEKSQKVSVNPGSHQRVSFTITKSTPGTYKVSVGNMNGSFTVSGLATVDSPAPVDNSPAISPAPPNPPSDISADNLGLNTVGVIAIAVIGTIVIAGVITVVLITRWV